MSIGREAADAAPPSGERGMVDFDKYRRFGAYHWRLIDTMPDYRRRVETVCRYVQPRDRCLDLGSGDGAYMYHVAQRCAYVTGVDGDPDGVRCAREELDRHGVTNYSLVHATFAELHRTLPDDTRFDLIYCMDCIEHLIDPREAVAAMLRYLTPRGHIVVGTPLFVAPDKVSQYHVREFTAAEVDELLEPSFQKLEHHLLDAPVPGSSELLPRFYVFVGRRRPRWWQVWRRAARLPRVAGDARPVVGRQGGSIDDHGSRRQDASPSHHGSRGQTRSRE